MTGYFWGMLSFDIRSLEAHAAVVDDVLSADDPVWEESDRKPVDGVRVSGRISSAGQGRFYWHAHLHGDVMCFDITIRYLDGSNATECWRGKLKIN